MARATSVLRRERTNLERIADLLELGAVESRIDALERNLGRTDGGMSLHEVEHERVRKVVQGLRNRRAELLTEIWPEVYVSPGNTPP